MLGPALLAVAVTFVCVVFVAVVGPGCSLEDATADRLVAGLLDEATAVFFPTAAEVDTVFVTDGSALVRVVFAGVFLVGAACGSGSETFKTLSISLLNASASLAVARVDLVRVVELIATVGAVVGFGPVVVRLTLVVAISPGLGEGRLVVDMMR